MDGVSRRLIPRALGRCLPERAIADANVRSYARADRCARPHAYANGAPYAYCKSIAYANARAYSYHRGIAYANTHACANANCDCDA